MKLIREILEYNLEYEELGKKLRKKGAKLIGAGDYGSVYLLNGRVYKITTDSVEIEHSQKVKGLKTRNFAHIFDVQQINPNLGIIKMELLHSTSLEEVPEDYIEATSREAERLGIDPDELDFRIENVMQRQGGGFKLVDL